MSIRTDQRTIKAERVPGARATLEQLAGSLLDAQLELARFLARLEETKHYRLEGCASIAEYATRVGISPRDARALCDLGRATVTSPDLERAVRERRTDVQRASIVSRILSRSELLRGDDDWTAWAGAESARHLYRRVRARQEEAAQAAPAVVQVTVYVREKTRDDFDRARVLASRREGTTLTPGQAFHRVVNAYLDDEDILRKPARARRMADTSELPDRRDIPAEVIREILRRSGDCCEFPGCNHRVHLQFAHIVPHWRGGTREAGNLLRLCTLHHALFDAGVIRLISDSLEDPVFWVKGVGTVCKQRPIHLGPEPSTADPGSRAPPDGHGAEVVAEAGGPRGASLTSGRSPPPALAR